MSSDHSTSELDTTTDSLIDGGFEVIESGVETTGSVYDSLPQPFGETQNFSIARSIFLNSLPTHSHTDSDQSISAHSEKETTSSVEPATPVMSQSAISAISGNDDALASVMRAQQETIQILQTQLAKIDSIECLTRANSLPRDDSVQQKEGYEMEKKKMHNELAQAHANVNNLNAKLIEVTMQAANDKMKVAEMEMTLENIKQNATDAVNMEREATAELKKSGDELQSKMAQMQKDHDLKMAEVADKFRFAIEEKELQIETMLTERATFEKEMEEKRDHHDSLKKQNESMVDTWNKIKETMAQKDAQIAALEMQVNDMETMHDKFLTGSVIQDSENKDQRIAELRAEIDALHAKHEKDISQLREENDFLHAQLMEKDEMLEASDRTMNNLRNEGNIPSTLNETMMMHQIRDKTSYCEGLEAELKNLRAQLSGALIDIENKDQIVKVLTEDHTEGNRLLTEKDFRIRQLEIQIKQFDLRRGDVNNC